MFEVSREVVDAEEILEVFGLGVEGGAPGVHPLYDGGHITEYYSVHDSWNIGTGIRNYNGYRITWL